MMGHAEENMPIAIVGMACRFPGDATSIRGLWDMCCSGKSAWSEIPKDRMNVDGFFHPDPSKTGSFNTRGAHFLKEDVGLFDAPFFNISPTEAQTMDPQQRLLLESTYEALEDSGIPLKKFMGGDVGVYVGASNSDYSDLLRKDPETGSTYQSTGITSSILANRISYIYNLKGPSIAVDTACSSSLTALYLACQGLRTQQTRQAVVGGVYVMLSPGNMIDMSMLRLFGRDGRSYTYDHRGTGYGRGEGVATLILKPLKDAIQDGDSIRSLIRNIGINQDGKTNGITFPSKEAQEMLIRSVYANAGLDPMETGYAEVHGTGTAAGDPVEANAVASALASQRSAGSPLVVGSVKTNIGHLEAASGLAGIIKSTLTLETGLIPPNINFEKPNKEIPLAKLKLKIPTEIVQWPFSGVRRASVSSFGFGGTNVHVILEAYCQRQFSSIPLHIQCDARLRDQPSINGVMEKHSELQPTDNVKLINTPQTNGHPIELNGTQGKRSQFLDNSSERLHFVNGDRKAYERSVAKPITTKRSIFVLTAFNEASCKKQRKNLAQHVEESYHLLSCPDDLKDDLAFTLDQRRSLFEWRLAFPAASLQELLEKLRSSDTVVVKAEKSPKVGFVFTGQGSQWYAMGRELMQYSVFAATMLDADVCLRDFGAQWSLQEELCKDAGSSLVNEAYVSQPATTAIQIALVSLLSSWNIRPDAVAGHSSGEIAAAHAAGALSLRSCMLVAYQRGYLASTLKQRFPNRFGGMLAIGASLENVKSVMKKVTRGTANIACINGPSLITVSGDEDAILELQQFAEGESWLARKLRVDVAYHSDHMQYIASDYVRALGVLVPVKTKDVPFFSTLKGHRIDTDTLDATYWAQNMTSPVLFSQAIHAMCISDVGGVDTLVEIGPHSALEAPIKDLLKAHPNRPRECRYRPSLVRNEDGSLTMLRLVSELFAKGHSANLSAVNNEGGMPRKVLHELPSYPWNHDKRYWHESRLSQNFRFRRFPRNDLLGSLVDDASDMEPRWRNVLRTSEVPWLLHHKVQSSTVLPLTGYLTMIIEAAYQRAVVRGVEVTDSSTYRFRQIAVNRSLILPDTAEVETSVTLKAVSEGFQSSSNMWDEFYIYSWTDKAGWFEHCRGLVALDSGKRDVNVIDGQHNFGARTSSSKQLQAHEELICTKAVDIPKAYEMFSRAGLEFGPMFQNLQEARACPGHCMGIVSIPHSAASMPYEFETNYIVHPATLDSCLHPVFMASSGGNPSSTTLHLPTYVESLSVSHGISKTPGNQLHVYAVAESSKSDREISASISVFDPTLETAIPIAEINGFVGTVLRTQNSEHGDDATRHLCYKVRWKPCLDLLQPSQFRETFAPATPEDADQSQIQRLERAAFYYIQEVFESIVEHDIMGFKPHHQKLYSCFKDLLTLGMNGKLPFQSPEWLAASPAARADFLMEVKLSDSCGQLLCGIGERLVGILRSEIDPISIMAKDDLLGRFYRDSETLKQANMTAANWVGALGHQNPQMRVIEIGAGTGGTTVSMLTALGGTNGKAACFSSYDFTDISTAFLERAEPLLRPWGALVQYSKLNIEEDPTIQGFEPESYDLVIASNVLHATAQMNRTLQNVRRLLKPSGKLLLIEITNLKSAYSLIFGTLPGWWIGEEPERQGGPILREVQWDHLLRGTGFSGLDGSIADDNANGPHTRSVMFTTASHEQRKSYPRASLISVGQSGDLDINSMSLSLKQVCGNIPRVISLSDFRSDDEYCIFLDLKDSFLSNLGNAEFAAMQNLLLTAKGVLWVTRGALSTNPDASMVMGLSRVVRSENVGVKVVTLDLDPRRQGLDVTAQDTIIRLFMWIFNSDAPETGCDMEFAERDGRIEIPRVLLDERKNRFITQETRAHFVEPQRFLQEGRPLKLKLANPGILDDIYFEDDRALEEPIEVNEIEIAVKAAGMNFKGINPAFLFQRFLTLIRDTDVMIGLGQIPYQEIGLECGGIVTAIGSGISSLQIGDRVCAMMADHSAYANRVRTPEHNVAKIPDGVSFVTAASIPIVFSTALYALTTVGHLSRDDSVLIHAAAGGVGQAAIMLAQNIGAEVFVTVGSIEKRDFIMDNFGVPQSHIFSSRDITFGQGVLRATNNKGVDVVLNSVAGESLRVTFECLAPLGRFVEIGKRDLVQNNRLEMKKFSEGVTFSAVDIVIVSSLRPKKCQQLLRDVVEMLRVGKIRPVSPITTYSMSEVQDALRKMQMGRHIGKLVIEPKVEDVVQAVAAPILTPVARSDASYLIAGGVGGLGRSMTRWLAQQGAKNIVLASRSGSISDTVSTMIQELKGLGVIVIVQKCDVADEKQVRELILRSERDMPPFRGVIHGAMVLRDKSFKNTSFDDWTEVIKPRVQGAWNLHKCLPSLDFFVMLASIAGTVGNRGQSAYAASNTFMDAFSDYRADLGLPAATIDIGIVADVGYVAQSDPQRRAQISLVSNDVVQEAEFLAVMKGAILQHPKGNSYRQTIAGLYLPGWAQPSWISNPRFSHLARSSENTSTPNAQGTSSISVRKALQDATSVDQAVSVTCAAVIRKVSSISMTPEEEIEANKPLVAYGLDSLVAVELRNWIGNELGASVPLLELTTSPSLEALARLIAAKSKLSEHVGGG